MTCKHCGEPIAWSEHAKWWYHIETNSMVCRFRAEPNDEILFESVPY